ncbi:GNAT family protein [Gryllotalpicola sp.]|uniref:GNAT family N-acetyltransferase n=1 Tax=Gryllotalpicola sp. TaxID=1932787 RepID=UPI002611E8D6|nr:GNAT family protein [Gryllotalpicola sp.]
MSAPITESIPIPYEVETLSTERLALVPMTLDEVTEAHSPLARSRTVTKYLRWEVRDHDDEADSRSVRKRLALSHITRQGDGFVWRVEFATPDGEQGAEIGDVSVFAKSLRNKQFEIGWVFHPAIHGRGLATEAAQKVLEIVFTKLGAHRVYAELDTRNEASGRLCSVLGMRQEAVLKERELVADEWHDVAIYAITESEWAARAA